MDEPKIIIATSSWMDEHVATCQKADCWRCDTYQRAYPQEYAAAIKRGRGALDA